MLEKLKELGILDAQNGQLSKEEEIILLHIYKSKLEGETPELVSVQDRIKKGELTSYSQELDEETACFFDGDFASGIEKIHAKLGSLRAEGKGEEKYSAARAYETLCDRMGKVSNAIKSKREELDTLGNWIENEDSFKAFCAASGVNVEGEKSAQLKSLLQTNFVAKQSEFFNAKSRALNLATDYILTTDVRSGKYEAAAAL